MSACDICDELAAIRAEQAWQREAMTLLLTNAGLPIPGGATTPGTIAAVTFDGANDYLTRGGALDGIANSPEGSVVFWILADSYAPADQAGIIRQFSGDGGLNITIQANGELRVILAGAGEELFRFDSDALSSGLGWKPVLISWKTDLSSGNKLCHLYVGDTDALDAGSITDADAAFDVALDGTEWTLFGPVAGSPLAADVAEFWFATSYIDFSVEANRRLFFDEDTLPVDLGDDGSIPLGSAPFIYLSVRSDQVASDFATNRGAGGGMTVTGTLELAPVGPLD